MVWADGDIMNSRIGIADSPNFRAQPPPLGSPAENLRTGNPMRIDDYPIRASLQVSLVTRS
jgi:hypothetical protein